MERHLVRNTRAGEQGQGFITTVVIGQGFNCDCFLYQLLATRKGHLGIRRPNSCHYSREYQLE